MKFCSNCENMLYITVQRNEGDKPTLHFTCKNCQYSEKSDNFVQSIPIVQKQLTENSGLSDETEDTCVMNLSYIDDDGTFKQYQNEHIKYDMTLPRVRNIKCPKNCKDRENNELNSEVICIKYDPINLKFLYYCVSCENFWKIEKTN